MQIPNDLISLEEATAKYPVIHQVTIRNWIKAGQLSAHKGKHRKIFFSEQEFVKILNAKGYFIRVGN